VQGQPAKRDSPLIAVYISLTSNISCPVQVWDLNRKYEWRMIIHDRATNNRHGIFSFLTVILILGSGLLSGCGNDTRPAQEEKQAITADLCGITVDDTPWRVFQDIVERTEAGQEVGRSDYQVFADLPVISLWKTSMSGNVPSVRIVNWLDETFNPSDRKTSKVSPTRFQFAANYHYSIDHRQDIDPLIKVFQSEDHACNVMKKIDQWFSDEEKPDSLVVVFMPSKAEIRIKDQHIFVDTAILQAGNFKQLENQLVAILFRARMYVPGDPPSAAEGQAAVAQCIRVMLNEGKSGYIEDLPSTIFSPDHPLLGKLDIIPELVFEHGIRGLSLINQHLPGMLADEEKMQAAGNPLAKTLIASNALNQGGFAMCATIAANLGDETLQKATSTPLAFLQAYQKAVKMNPSPAPKPHEVMDQLYLSMVPFDDEVYDGLVKILKEEFPGQE